MESLLPLSENYSADVHQVNAVIGTNFRSSEAKSEEYKAVGFPSGDFTRPSFATGFPDGIANPNIRNRNSFEQFLSELWICL